VSVATGRGDLSPLSLEVGRQLPARPRQAATSHRRNPRRPDPPRVGRERRQRPGATDEHVPGRGGSGVQRDRRARLTNPRYHQSGTRPTVGQIGSQCPAHALPCLAERTAIRQCQVAEKANPYSGSRVLDTDLGVPGPPLLSDFPAGRRKTGQHGWRRDDKTRGAHRQDRAIRRCR
jgi:hypothetical protein